ncbi:methyltransferase family protein [Fontibacillus phaseoli]|uniref:Methyltransferase family protein n=1 Tax=Fontibacillus phaseoli TaxID=1416533 RepID=A0A369BBB1_9BACL|nr:methyltransferase domain-containing protein [Fontibacillus phaseoli]RCX16954.1 methyltransferase family protein [Fontibacillus phaseoli]
MGTSNWQNLSYCIELIRQVSPSRVLDIGIGFGRWGMICREFLDVWQGRVHREQWMTVIEGIEIFPKNVDEYHSYFYNEIHIADAYELLTQHKVGTFDLIILGDVLEHFDKERAIALLEACLQTGRYVLLNIPIGNDWPQGSEYGNDYEMHRSEWTMTELDPFPTAAKKKFKDYINREFATYLFQGRP